jgi:hypothetical protein
VLYVLPHNGFMVSGAQRKTEATESPTIKTLIRSALARGTAIDVAAQHNAATMSASRRPRKDMA